MSVAEETIQTPVEETTVVETEITDIVEAAKLVIKQAIAKDAVIAGLRKVNQAIVSKTAKVAFLAEDCDEAAIKQLVNGLAKENGIPVVTLPSKMSLGEWCGQCKVDADGTARKIVNASTAVITEFGAESNAKEYLLNYIKENSA